jgi:hypothetical protein
MMGGTFTSVPKKCSTVGRQTLLFQFDKDILQNSEADEYYLWRSILRDEATFYISGTLNLHICRIWGSETPQAISEIERDSVRGNVRCVLPYSEDLRPSFFEKQTNSTGHNFFSYNFIFHEQFYFVISGLKIIGYRKPDNNLELPSIMRTNWSSQPIRGQSQWFRSLDLHSWQPIPSDI